LTRRELTTDGHRHTPISREPGEFTTKDTKDTKWNLRNPSLGEALSPSPIVILSEAKDLSSGSRAGSAKGLSLH